MREKPPYKAETFQSIKTTTIRISYLGSWEKYWGSERFWDFNHKDICGRDLVSFIFGAQRGARLISGSIWPHGFLIVFGKNEITRGPI